MLRTVPGFANVGPVLSPSRPEEAVEPLRSQLVTVANLHGSIKHADQAPSGLHGS